MLTICPLTVVRVIGPMPDLHRKKQPRIAVYTGEGASHSWTWFADMFDREHAGPVVFVDEAAVRGGALEAADVFFVSGGDTFAIAAALGGLGARAIERFIRDGGTYIGACAGAYLLLKSSLEPLHYFNFVNAKIANLTRCLPPALQRPEKYCTAYGCRYVFHPVREEVGMRCGAAPHEERSVHAPLYGGPAMIASDDIEVLATYAGFTEASEFLVEESVAAETLIGNVAAARKCCGRGVIYLFGPHFEHPDFPEANRIMFDCLAGARASGEPAHRQAPADPAGRAGFRAFLSELSNARIMALALERSRYQWLIGAKVYDPEKIRIFLEAIWKRARALDTRCLQGCCSSADIERLGEALFRCSVNLRALRTDALCGCAEELFRDLRQSAAAFMNMYFSALYTAGHGSAAAISSQPARTKARAGRAQACHQFVY